MKKITLFVSVLMMGLTFSQTATVTSVPDVVARSTNMAAAATATVTSYTVDFVNIPLADGESLTFFSGWKTGTDDTGTDVGGGRNVIATNNSGTITITGGATMNSSSDNGDGTVNYNVSFTNLNAFGTLPDYDATINYGLAAFPSGLPAIRSNRLASVVESAPASIDEFAFNFSGTLLQASSIDIPITYTSDEPVQAGAISIRLVAAKSPFVDANSEIEAGTYSNSSILPAAPGGSTSTITMSSFPANLSVGGVANGVILASRDPNNTANSIPSQLSDADPFSQPGATAVFYFIDPVATTSDPEWLPASQPGRIFFGILQDLTLSNDDFALNNNKISVAPNPTNGEINISGLKDVKSIWIYNLLGQEVKRFEASPKLDISDLKSGVYLLRADNGFMQKIMKK